jgi:hypothetical protein
LLERIGVIFSISIFNIAYRDITVLIWFREYYTLGSIFVFWPLLVYGWLKFVYALDKCCEVYSWLKALHQYKRYQEHYRHKATSVRESICECHYLTHCHFERIIYLQVHTQESVGWAFVVRELLINLVIYSCLHIGLLFCSP